MLVRAKRKLYYGIIRRPDDLSPFTLTDPKHFDPALMSECSVTAPTEAPAVEPAPVKGRKTGGVLRAGVQSAAPAVEPAPVKGRKTGGVLRAGVQSAATPDELVLVTPASTDAPEADPTADEAPVLRRRAAKP